jgi:hypothetical protein
MCETVEYCFNSILCEWSASRLGRLVFVNKNRDPAVYEMG